MIMTIKMFYFQLKSVADPIDNCSLGFAFRYNDTLMTIIVTGDEQPSTPYDKTLPPRPYYVRDFRNTPESEIYPEKFVIELSNPRLLNRERFSGPSDIRYDWQYQNDQCNNSWALAFHNTLPFGVDLS